MARAWLRDIDEKRKLRGLGTGFIVLGLLVRQENRGFDLLPGVLLGYEQGKEKGRALPRWVPCGSERRGGACLPARERKGRRWSARGWDGSWAVRWAEAGGGGRGAVLRVGGLGLGLASRVVSLFFFFFNSFSKKF